LIPAAKRAINIMKSRESQAVQEGGSMKGPRVKWLCSVIFIISIMLASGAKAQVSNRGQEPGHGQVTDQQQAPGKEKSGPKEFRKVFCAERSEAQKFYTVDDVNCSEVCDNVYREHPCELQARLNEGWRVTSVSTVSTEVQKDPCECRVTGIESVLERK
jgi:hypothetical protein